MAAGLGDGRRLPEQIHAEFLKYAPAYAIGAAAEAIARIEELQAQRVIRDGVYYIVLADLVGSTKYAAAHGNQAAADRVERFVTASFHALNQAPLRNTALFVKEIGDAVLFVFQHFPDVLHWRAAFGDYLALPMPEPIEIRTCVHIGEVSLEGVNPLSLAVSQCFKMEKAVHAHDLVLTDPAYIVAWPTVDLAHSAFADYGEVELEGFPRPVALHVVDAHDPAAFRALAVSDH